MSSLKYKKIYFDTKYKTADSKSTSDFKVELPETLSFENNSVFYVDDIAVPHSWWTVEDFNNKLYVCVYDGASPGAIPGNTYSHIITLSNGNYTGTDLAAEISTKFASVVGGGYSCFYLSKSNTLQIGTTSPTLKFKVLTPNELKTGLNGAFSLSYDKNKPNDCNEVLSNLEVVSQVCDTLNPFKSGYLNMQPIRNLYLHSSNLGNYNSIGPDGSQTIIKKIPVTSDYNIMIFDQCVLYNDYNDCSHQTIKTLSFQLKTSRGDVVPLHGVDISFSIVFSRASPDV